LQKTLILYFNTEVIAQTSNLHDQTVE